MNNEQILSEFDSNFDRYAKCSKKFEQLIKELMDNERLELQSILSRVKNRESLSDKLIRKQGAYKSIIEVTDIVGARIVAYYTDDINLISDVVEREFVIDEINSADKADSLEDNKFGYLSRHFVVSLPDSRTKLSEYALFQGMKFELQVRTILQHAWAEIEHDIGYKAEVEVPRKIRRRLFRLAGLLELADTEFTAIRKEDRRYRANISQSIELDPSHVEINLATISEFIGTSEIVADLDRELAGILPLNFMELHESVSSQYVQIAHFFKIQTISQLSEELSISRDIILGRASYELKIHGALATDSPRSVYRGICLSYYGQMMAAASGKQPKVQEYLKTIEFGTSNSRKSFSEFLINAYKNIRGS